MAPAKAQTQTLPVPATLLVREFEMDKDTPGTHRFKEDEPQDGSRPAIGSLYITKKALMPLGNVKRIRVTIEAIGG